MIFRILIAGIGGYLLAALASITLSLAFPLLENIEAVALASMLSFLIWLGFVIYSFSNVKLSSLIMQLTLICMNLYLINTCLSGLKG